MIGGGKCHGLFGASCDGIRTTLGRNRKYLVLCDACVANKTAPPVTVREPLVQVQEDLVSPLASKRKRVVSAKESDNTVFAVEKRQRLAEVATNKSQREIDSTQNQAKLEKLVARNGKKAPSAGTQRPLRKTKAQLAKEKKEAEMAAAAEDSEQEAE
jgi:hypothetical protein